MNIRLVACLGTLSMLSTGPLWAQLPVIPPEGRMRSKGIRNLISLEQIHNVVGPSRDGKGLLIDLEDETLFGSIYSGPYPFEQDESDYDYMRFRMKTPLRNGKGVIHCLDFVSKDKLNANDWPAATQTLAYRLEVYQERASGTPRTLGFYNGLVSFTAEKASDESYVFRKKLTVIEGPLISLLTSDNPGGALLTWQTDRPCRGRVLLRKLASPGGRVSRARVGRRRSGGVGAWRRIRTDPQASSRHEVGLTGLSLGADYEYRVECVDDQGTVTQTPVYRFHTAPPPGEGKVVFAFASDSREGVGGGERNYMGHNAAIFKQVARDAYRRGAEFLLFGGDLVNGYTTETEDFRLQMWAWKQSLAGFWRSRAVYPVMGNHEALLNVFRNLSMDQWPYATDSAEAVFAQEFWNPINGPEPADPRRPPYRENVYSFQYGPVLCVGYNNNYWWTTNDKCQVHGGCPEGYLMDDQLRWIEATLQQAEANETVKYIVVYAQEPVFPCGGHVGDCMWWNGSNELRACTYTNGETVAEATGMLESRDRFWTALSGSTKVAVVLSGDEHEYHRLLVDSKTPVGVLAIDDKDGNDKLDDGQISPNPAFKHAIWHVTAGTAGAPYYAREETPWEPVVLSSQTGYCLFEATQEKISMTFYTTLGQAVDVVDDLMAVKRTSPPR